MQAGCHATRVISRPNGVADEPFASTDLQLCAYNLEQSGAMARPYGLAIALDAEGERLAAEFFEKHFRIGKPHRQLM